MARVSGEAAKAVSVIGSQKRRVCREFAVHLLPHRVATRVFLMWSWWWLSERVEEGLALLEGRESHGCDLSPTCFGVGRCGQDRQA